eukprot:6402048-Alexandrium_andersonii.AAC.1
MAALEPQRDLLGVRTFVVGDSLFVSGLSPDTSEDILSSSLARWIRATAPPVVYIPAPVDSPAAARHARLIHG